MARARRAVVLGGLLAGVVLRAWLVSTPLGRADVDEAVVGLMARHVLHGEVRVFFWGQPYGGTQEQLLTAAFFAVGRSSVWVLRAVPIGLTAVATWLVWRVGRRTVGDDAGRLAAVVFWAWPGVFVWWSVKSRGFYEITLVLGLVVMLAALRLVERPSWRDAALLGAAAGSGAWASPQIAFFVVPAVTWALVRNWRLVRLAGVTAVAAVAGALPWLVYNARHDWVSLHPLSGKSGYFGNVRSFFKGSLPVALGLRRPFTLGWALPVVALAAYLALLAGAAWYLWRRPAGTGLVLLTLAAFPLIFPVTPFVFVQVFEPRYVWFLSPLVALLGARALTAARWPGAPVGLAALVLLSTLALSSFVRWAERNPDAQVVGPRDLTALVSRLRDNGADRVFTPYSIAYRVSFESDERVVATPIETIGVRYRPFDRKVSRSPNPAYAFLKGGAGDRFFRRFLDRRRMAYRRLPAGHFVAYLLEAKLLPDDVPGLRNGFGLGLA